MLSLTDFYFHPEVRRRIVEYCGGEGDNFSSFTAATLVGYGEKKHWIGKNHEEIGLSPQEGFEQILGNGWDIFRSSWDKMSSLGILDVEYFNMDYPGEIYLNPYRTFSRLELLYKTVLSVFYKFNIIPLVIMTGRGYHFSIRLPQNNKIHQKIEEIGSIPSSIKSKYLGLKNRGLCFSLKQGKAYEGLGRLMEYVVHLVIKKMRNGEIPVVCTDLAVGMNGSVREAISLDLSMYGDPLHFRHIRCPFSTYQKHKNKGFKIGELAAKKPVQVALPRMETVKMEDLCQWKNDFRKASDYAAKVETRIPDASKGCENLIRSYKRSQLYQFHKHFDSQEHDLPSDWEKTYDRFDLGKLPPCISHSLSFPNDNLLKPTNIQAITRVLLKEKWHPKHIAGLIRSKYERNYGWGNMWVRNDANLRADFYVRLFAGLLSDGTDQEEDLNCISYQKKGFCWKKWCGYSLEHYKIN